MTCREQAQPLHPPTASTLALTCLGHVLLVWRPELKGAELSAHPTWSLTNQKLLRPVRKVEMPGQWPLVPKAAQVWRRNSSAKHVYPEGAPQLPEHGGSDKPLTAR